MNLFDNLNYLNCLNAHLVFLTRNNGQLYRDSSREIEKDKLVIHRTYFTVQII